MEDTVRQRPSLLLNVRLERRVILAGHRASRVHLVPTISTLLESTKLTVNMCGTMNALVVQNIIFVQVQLNVQRFVQIRLKILTKINTRRKIAKPAIVHLQPPFRVKSKPIQTNT